MSTVKKLKFTLWEARTLGKKLWLATSQARTWTLNIADVHITLQGSWPNLIEQKIHYL